MKLIYNKYTIDIDFAENEVQVLVVEHPNVLAEIIEDLSLQCEGGEGGFILSENLEPVSIKNNVIFFTEPFSLDCNNKRILTKLYKSLEKDLQTSNDLCWANVNQSITEYLEHICNESDIPLIFDAGVDFCELVKIGNLRADTQAVTLVEKILEYLILENTLFGKSQFIFLNLKSFLATEDLEKLYQECFYRKWTLMLIEAFYKTKLGGEKVCIIDKDQCIINI